MSGMATHVVGGVMGYSGGEEAGDDVVMGAGAPAVQPREDVRRVGRALDPAGCSPCRKALDDRFDLHAVVGGVGHSICLDALRPRSWVSTSRRRKAQPPGPGWPRQLPSVKMWTVFIAMRPPD
jgi:hypothetical protein